MPPQIESNTKNVSGGGFSFLGDDPEGKDLSINENAHDYQQPQYSRESSRPGFLTQHSHHDLLTGSSSFPDEVSKLQTPQIS